MFSIQTGCTVQCLFTIAINNGYFCRISVDLLISQPKHKIFIVAHRIKKHLEIKESTGNMHIYGKLPSP